MAEQENNQAAVIDSPQTEVPIVEAPEGTEQAAPGPRFKPESAYFWIEPLTNVLKKMTLRDKLIFSLAVDLVDADLRSDLEVHGLYDGDIFDDLAADCEQAVNEARKNESLGEEEALARDVVKTLYDLTH